jgi:sialate O-acetylesterase
VSASHPTPGRTRLVQAASVALLFLLAALPVRAELSLGSPFGDHMVLQRELPVPVWGRTTPGAPVIVEFAGQRKSATADSAGRWRVTLDPLTANATATELVVTSDGHTLRVTDVLVGDVWLCSGQSNMEWALAKSDGGSNAIAAANHPLLRLGRVPHNVQSSPQERAPVTWDRCTPASAKNASAMPYWFGLKLQQALGVPVGVLNNSFGGTTIQAWLPEEELAKGPWLQDKMTSPALARADYDRRAEAQRPLREKYEAERAAAREQRLPSPPVPPGLMSEYKGPATMWNGAIFPLLPFRFRGVAWYQGKSNAYVGVAGTYGDFLDALLRVWRSAFEQPDLPFLIFQVARNRKWQTDPNEASGIAQLQEIQARVAHRTSNTVLIVSNDQGGPDVHYTGKEPVAARAANAALSLEYGKPAPYRGPEPREVRFESGRALIRFAHAQGGLVSQDGPLTGFVIAGADRKFSFAEARIEGDCVIVTSADVPAPVAVRHGWADLPKVNLFNGDGLPAAPFRTDDWPIVPNPPSKP